MTETTKPKRRRAAKPTAETKKDTAASEAQALIDAAKAKQAAAAEDLKKAEREAEKEKKAAKAEQFKATTLKKLEPLARDINARFDRIETSQKKTDDHRLAAALNLATAKERCREAKVPFKSWVEKNIKQSFETARKLLAIGSAELEEEGKGKLMLEDMRSKNKEANQKLRDKKAEGGDSSPPQSPPQSPPPPKVADPVKIRQQVDTLSKEDWRAFMDTQAHVGGFKLVDEDEAMPADDAKLSMRDRAESAFRRLGAKQKLAFATWVAEQVGAVLEMAE